MTNEQLAVMLRGVLRGFSVEVSRLEAELLASPCVEVEEFTTFLGDKRRRVVAMEDLKLALDDTFALVDTLLGGS